MEIALGFVRVSNFFLRNPRQRCVRMSHLNDCPNSGRKRAPEMHRKTIDDRKVNCCNQISSQRREERNRQTRERKEKRKEFQKGLTIGDKTTKQFALHSTPYRHRHRHPRLLITGLGRG